MDGHELAWSSEGKWMRRVEERREEELLIAETVSEQHRHGIDCKPA